MAPPSAATAAATRARKIRLWPVKARAPRPLSRALNAWSSMAGPAGELAAGPASRAGGRPPARPARGAGRPRRGGALLPGRGGGRRLEDPRPDGVAAHTEVGQAG